MKSMQKSLRLFVVSIFVVCVFSSLAIAQEKADKASTDSNILTVAVAWKQTAAEYRALYYQGFNVAKMHLEKALKDKKAGDKPLAVVTDLDDTLVLPLKYWGHLVANNVDFFDDPIWDAWIPEYQLIPSPGAMEFLEFCKENNIEVFYVTSREQGDDTYKFAIEQMKKLGFPYVDEQHVTVLRDTSNKEKPQQKIAEKYDIVVYLGDNLNDFRRIYYVKGNVDERIKLMEQDKDKFGSKFILFPNPTDGHWISAIFGDSEPPATDENRAIWKEAATKHKF